MNRTKRLLFSMLTLLCSCTGAWAQSTSDVLSGIFTINASGTTVQFSKGNLQYVNGNWQFAVHQFDYIGNNQSDNNKDLFAFNGYSTPDASWFNMSHDQWKYLLATRSVTNTLSDGARYTMATLGGTYKGLIIFPDDYTHPDGTGFVAGTYNGHSDFTATVSLAGWALMEAAGCVFLPAAGYYSHGRKEYGGFGEAVDINTTTSYNDDNFYTPVFKSDNLNYDDKSYKQSLIPVRLVQLKTDLQKDADGYYLIGSVNDWKGFAALVEIIPKANAKMTADIDLGDDQTHISGTWKGESSPEHYGGIFDGQGHTLTVNYNDNKYFKAPFGHCYGATIKNLHVAGYIYARSQNPHTAGVMCNSTGNDLVQNVWVSATINTNSDAAGAFIGLNNSGASTIRDCLFTGTITTVNGTGDGCFLGRVRNGSSNIINCLSTGTFDYYGSGSFDGTHTNCYVKQFDGTIPAAMQLTDAQLTDGTITTALQNGRSEVIWVQDPLTNQPRQALFAGKYTVPSSGLGTFSAKANFTLPEGLEAYYCKNYDASAGTIAVIAIDGVVPAETGVLLRGTAGATYTLTGTNAAAAEVTGNALVAVTDGATIQQTDGDYTNFGLSGGTFKKVNTAGGTVGANRAYLHILTSALTSEALARGFSLAWDDDATMIEDLTIDGKRNADGCYDLQGRRVENPTKGLYIVNGKKVIIK